MLLYYPLCWWKKFKHHMVHHCGQKMVQWLHSIHLALHNGFDIAIHHSYEYYMILVKQLGMTGWNIFNPHVNSLILRNVPFRPTKRTILHVLFWIIRALCVTWCGWHILFIRFSNVSSIQRFQPSSSCFAFNIFGKEFKKVTVNISFEKS